MKKIFTILTFLTATSIFATDRYVDPNLSSGNGTTLFTNITSAVAAAVNGDRIIVSSNTYNEATLTISKSLKIIPQTAGTTINLNANIIIAGFTGMKFEILGFNLGVYSINSNIISGGDYSNRAKISIIDCSITSIDFDKNFYECNIIRNSISQSLNFRYGNVVLNTVNNISFLDEDQNNPSGTTQKTLITNNNISNYIFIYNNDSKLVLANNIITNGLYLKRWYSDSSYKNKIVNNQFSTSGSTQLLVSTINVPVYNLIFSNNVGNISFYCGGDTGGFAGTNLNYNTMDSIYLDLGWYYTATSNQGLTTSLFPSNDVNGVFEWSYNGFLLPHSAPAGNQPLSFINIAGTNNIIDAGNPNHDYYDIDLTINDRGTSGGPYSSNNYVPTTNPNNSKAFIFDLDIPTDLFPGQNVNISAKGYHKN